MKKYKIELTRDECAAVMNLARKVDLAVNPPATKPKKWIHDGEYLVNTKTGARINKFTKRRG